METGRLERNKPLIWLPVFLAAIVGLVFLNCITGSVKLTPSELMTAVVRVLHGEENTRAATILFAIRIPRTIAAMVLGGGLALSGYLLQTFFRNPIAGPFVLGISSGAKFIVALCMIFLLGNNVKVSSWTLIGAAFVGSMISMGLVLLMAGRVKQMGLLVVAGVMIGYIANAVTDLVVTFADDSDIVNLHNWSRGSFSGINGENVIVLSIVTAVSCLLCLFLVKPINAYRMGEGFASSVGVNILGLRCMLVLISSVLSAAVVAFAGPVSFVGVAVPHIVRKLIRTERPGLMMPLCFMGGSIFCLASDLIARILFAPTELSVSTVTAVFGAPVVIYMLLEKRR